MRRFQVAEMSYKLEYTMMHYHDSLSKLFLGETTDIEQWPDTFQSCSQFTARQQAHCSYRLKFLVVFKIT